MCIRQDLEFKYGIMDSYRQIFVFNRIKFSVCSRGCITNIWDFDELTMANECDVSAILFRGKFQNETRAFPWRDSRVTQSDQEFAIFTSFTSIFTTLIAWRNTLLLGNWLKSHQVYFSFILFTTDMMAKSYVSYYLGSSSFRCMRMGRKLNYLRKNKDNVKSTKIGRCITMYDYRVRCQIYFELGFLTHFSLRENWPSNHEIRCIDISLNIWAGQWKKLISEFGLFTSGMGRE